MARTRPLRNKSPDLRRRDRPAASVPPPQPVPAGLGLAPQPQPAFGGLPLGLAGNPAMGQGINPAGGMPRQGGPAWADMLQGLGIGLLTGDNWGEGAGQGLLYAKQFGDQRIDRERQARLDQMQTEKFQFERDEAQRALDTQKKLDSGYQMFVSRLTDDDPTNDVPGLTREQGMFMAGLPADTGYQVAAPFMFPDPVTASSSLGKLREDLKAGRITQPEFDAAVKKETYIKPEPGAGSFEVDINGDGVPEFTMGGAGISKEWQSKDNAFANRLDNAIVGMDSAEASGYDPTATSAGGLADYVGQRSIQGLVGNALTSDKGKLWYRNAKEALAVVLRKDTGAAVTPQEFDLYGPIYLPMPWDDQATKASKKQAMLVMRNSLRQGIGQTPTQPQESPAPTPEPTPQPQPTTTAPGGGLPQPKSAAERDALPPGSQYIAPDGSVRTKR